ncbi:hypothetical protein DFH11DRAFT_1727704 [Phellopilus nigrolimitatus]|nr:hypothetical protein DFH11DRAFT_1727704 [Phellopilus nigrolimitatus]
MPHNQNQPIGSVHQHADTLLNQQGRMARHKRWNTRRAPSSRARADRYAQQHKPPKRRRHEYGLQQQQQQHRQPPPQQQQQQPPPPPQQQTPSPPFMPAQPPSRRVLRYTPAHLYGHLKPQLHAAVFLPGGDFPAQNAQGQRICRQCDVPGCCKDGKCVEKWGPGPERPGTVRPVVQEDEARRAPRYFGLCERKSAGADDRAPLVAPALAHSQSQSALAHSAGQSQHASVGHARVIVRQGALLVHHHTGRAQTQSQMLSPSLVSHHREHESDQEIRGGSSRSHFGSPVSAYTSAVASGRLHPAESAHLNQG